MSKVTIIGAGIGGLTCGNLLAGKGHEVTIFESHSAPGGYTAGFWRKGFYFESGTVSFESMNIIERAMKHIGVFDKLEFSRQQIRWASPKFDFIPGSFDDIQKNIMNAYPNEKDNLSRFFSEMEKMVLGFSELSKSPNSSGYEEPPSKPDKTMSILRKYSNTTLSEFCGQFFSKDSETYRLFKHMGYPDMSALILAAAILSFSGDYWTVKNGMQSWADVLAENFRKRGGELKLNSRVDAIVTEKGTAIGVKSKGEIFKSDYVISASDFKKTFFELLDDRSALKQDFISRTEKAPVSEAFFTVYLGLDMPDEALRAQMKIPHMHYYDYSPDYDIENRNDTAFFEKTSPSLYSPSLINSDLAPDGQSSLMIQCMCPHRWMDNWGNGDKKVYNELKRKAMQSLIKKTGKIVPDLKKHIIFMDAATPLTYERFTSNTNGASSAWSWNPKKKYYENPIGAKVTTPVKNLLLSSCWTAQIGGVPSAIEAAYKCARIVA